MAAQGPCIVSGWCFVATCEASQSCSTSIRVVSSWLPQHSQHQGCLTSCGLHTVICSSPWQGTSRALGSSLSQPQQGRVTNSLHPPQHEQQPLPFAAAAAGQLRAQVHSSSLIQPQQQGSGSLCRLPAAADASGQLFSASPQLQFQAAPAVRLTNACMLSTHSHLQKVVQGRQNQGCSLGRP